MSKLFNEILTIPRFVVYQIGLSPFGLFVLFLILIGINVGFYFAIKKMFKLKKNRVLATILGLVISMGIVGLLATTAGQAIRFVKYEVPSALNQTETRVFIRYGIFVTKPDHFNNNTRIVYKDPVSKIKHIATIKNDLGDGQYEVVSADEKGNLWVRNINHDWITAKD